MGNYREGGHSMDLDLPKPELDWLAFLIDLKKTS
ncbi:hypothetical protein Poly24_29980 [Rosistilla carotiformis]|uniref:Uncharacterized protein n=1 Tax=Rosistilla carotiformis TaxID=2528017 RepID=A0A518JUR2_9BACT|nr:hypothetical protein Poly24_29980 [Rosistilla carotiformis]